jgi:LmbE family N-acetylglucosaminyl deacetylase
VRESKAPAELLPIACQAHRLLIWTDVLSHARAIAIAAALSVAPASQLPIAPGTRAMIVAPHPDDEVLAAGGLIQRLHAAGAAVRVVYVTDGDGFPAGVEAEEKREHVTASDFRDYASERKGEAREALRILGLDDDAATFLGFPDAGLSRLLAAYWSDRRPPYRSPYTRRDRPRTSETLAPATRFRGEDLTQALARVIAAFRPTMIVTPRPEDQHVDHCAAWFFTSAALGDIARVDRAYRADLLTYVIHAGSWPYDGDVPPMSAGRSGWLRLRLTVQEQRRKLQAIEKYKTQLKVMESFLKAFDRPEEVFARPPATRVVLPLRANPCDRFKS